MEDATVNIDGQFQSSAVHDGYIAIALEPGDHKLIQLRAMGQHLASALVEDESPFRKVRGGGGGARYIYIPGGSYTTYYTSLAVDRSFHIEQGKVTNLGLIVYIPVPEDPNKKRATVNDSREFNVVALDNSAEIGNFLETNYPQLVSTLTARDVSLAPAKYLDAKRLPDLRRVIAYYESRGPHRIVNPSKTIIYGRAGTIAVARTPNGGEPFSPGDVEIVDSGTLADIVGAAQLGNEFTFLTSDAKLLSLTNGNLDQTALPFRIHPVSLNALGEHGLVVVDNHMRILTSRYPGDKWLSYDGAMNKTPRSDVDVVADSEGVYISLGRVGMPSALYYLKAGDSTPIPIAAAENKPATLNTAFHSLVARDAGLFVVFNKPDFYFHSKAGQKWELYSMPPGNCKPIRFDESGLNLSVQCADITYSSDNSGASWSKPEI